MGLLDQELYPNSSWGTREDGSAKGTGWLGNIGAFNGSVMSELGASADLDGRRIQFPLIVPTLTPAELTHLRSGGIPTRQIYDKAIQHAIMQMQSGGTAFKE
jgi:hypothetical protein